MYDYHANITNYCKYKITTKEAYLAFKGSRSENNMARSEELSPKKLRSVGSDIKLNSFIVSKKAASYH